MPGQDGGVTVSPQGFRSGMRLGDDCINHAPHFWFSRPSARARDYRHGASPCRALAEHRSQVAPNHPYLALSTRERLAVSPTEDFTVRLSRIAVHPPEDDLFAGLR